MSATLPIRRSNPFLTERLYGTRIEFLDSLSEVVATSDIDPDQAEGLLCGVVCDLWNDAELLAQRAMKVRELESALVATPAEPDQIVTAPRPPNDPPGPELPAPVFSKSVTADAPAEIAIARPVSQDRTLETWAQQSSQPEDLAACVQRVMSEKRLSPSQVGMRAECAGFKISDETIQLLRGSAKNLTIVRLQALAAGLGEPLEAVLCAAAGIQLKVPDPSSGAHAIGSTHFRHFRYLSLEISAT